MTGSTSAPAAASAATRPLASPFVACFLYAVRVCVPPKRWALLALPAGASVLFGLLARLIESPSRLEAFNDITLGLFGLVLPFACLVVGDAVLAAETRSGALANTWLSPTPFRVIILARWTAGWLLTCVALLPGVALAALVAGAPEALGPVLLAMAAGGGAYVALFMVIGATFARSSILWSLGILFLGERLLGAVLTGIAQLSPLWQAWNVYAGLVDDADDILYENIPEGWSAVVRLALITAVCLLGATRRLQRIKLSGSGD